MGLDKDTMAMLAVQKAEASLTQAQKNYEEDFYAVVLNRCLRSYWLMLKNLLTQLRDF
ncbi:MAG: hypothetical protein LBJ74_00785 [Heliobacteriaceae bacterium]|jgi:uncharacterized protein (UPF0332 family)|nr:hypothetical protein [Heliobacteriaceae bacterium]